MAVVHASFQQAMEQAGIPRDIQKYIVSRDITSVEVMASIAFKVEEVDEILAKPLESEFELPGGEKILLSKLEFPGPHCEGQASILVAQMLQGLQPWRSTNGADTAGIHTSGFGD